MKLIIAILQDSIAQEAIRRLGQAKHPVTKLSSTGGFMKSGNTTILTGVADEIVDDVVAILKETVSERESEEKNVAMANIFVLPMEAYRKM